MQRIRAGCRTGMISLTDTFFELFDLPARFDLDAAHLQSRFLQLQSAVHPDRYTDRSDAEKRLAMQWSTHVNEAYGTLKDPVRRAAYWCELQGHPVNAEYHTAMTPGFLMQQMEWRETLADAASEDALLALEKEVRNCRQTTLARLAAAVDEERNALKAAELTRQMMFIDKFRNELNSALADLDA